MFMQFAAAVSSWSYGIHMSHLYQWLIISELCRTNLANCAFDQIVSQMFKFGYQQSTK